MKSSIIVPVQDSTPFSPFCPGDGLEVNLARASEAGYDGVELAITNPGPLDVFEIKHLLTRYKLSMPAITTGQAYGVEGLSLIARDEKIRKKAIQRIEGHIRLARELGAVVIIGLIRGKQGGKKSKNLLIEALADCASFDDEVKLVLEPLNRYESSLINTVDEALSVIEQIEANNIGILFDTFHANIEETSMERSIGKARGRLFHVHVADSNRWVPGYGHLNFKQISRALSRISYQGFCSLESLPEPDREHCLREAAEYIRKL